MHCFKREQRDKTKVIMIEFIPIADGSPDKSPKLILKNIFNEWIFARFLRRFSLFLTLFSTQFSSN